jgi:BirA family biotin operon repressor/biotin-[acetyl-CoA-carboxylase] ligase
MDEARKIGRHGSVIIAELQSAGRGRLTRPWYANPYENLTFTVVLQYTAIPAVLSLRVGVAVFYALTQYIPSLNGKVQIKWPNDCLINAKKVAGILVESDGQNVYIGIGINVNQTDFGADLNHKVSSIALALSRKIDSRFALLETVLKELCIELSAGKSNWCTVLNEHLYKKGEKIQFKIGGADSTTTVEATLINVNTDGMLVVQYESGAIKTFITGEILFV